MIFCGGGSRCILLIGRAEKSIRGATSVVNPMVTLEAVLSAPGEDVIQRSSK